MRVEAPTTMEHHGTGHGTNYMERPGTLRNKAGVKKPGAQRAGLLFGASRNLPKRDHMLSIITFRSPSKPLQASKQLPHSSSMEQFMEHLMRNDTERPRPPATPASTDPPLGVQTIPGITVCFYSVLRNHPPTIQRPTPAPRRMARAITRTAAHEPYVPRPVRGQAHRAARGSAG